GADGHRCRGYLGRADGIDVADGQPGLKDDSDRSLVAASSRARRGDQRDNVVTAMVWTDEDRRELAELCKADDKLRADHEWDELQRAKAQAAETLTKSAEGSAIFRRRQDNPLVRRADPDEGASDDGDGAPDLTSPGSGVNVDDPAVFEPGDDDLA